MVKLWIEDVGGKVWVIDFLVYVNQLLLVKGVIEFFVFGGVYLLFMQCGFFYLCQWIVIGFVWCGLIEQLMVVVSFQGNWWVKQGGVELLWGSLIGLIGFNLVVISSW